MREHFNASANENSQEPTQSSPGNVNHNYSAGHSQSYLANQQPFNPRVPVFSSSPQDASHKTTQATLSHQHHERGGKSLPHKRLSLHHHPPPSPSLSPRPGALPSVNCAMAQCTNWGSKTTAVMYHRFPKSEELRQTWVLHCKRSDKFNPDNVKSLFSTFPARGLRTEKFCMEMLLQLYSIANWHGDVASGSSTVTSISTMTCQNAEQVLRDRESWHEVRNVRKWALSTLEIIDQVTSTNPLQNELILKLRKRVEGLEKANTALRLRESGNKQVKWFSEDIANALTLRSLSRKIFEETKHSFAMPFNITEMYQTRCCVFLKARAVNYKECEKFAVLTFDEMNLDGRISYDSSDDRILVPHSNVQVAMILGPFASWKQPIFYDFDVTMASELLKNIIREFEAYGICVVSVTCDMRWENAEVWKELNVNTAKVFCDVPHLLKLLRNHFLGEGLTLAGDTEFQKKTIQELLDTRKGELSTTHHINKVHISIPSESESVCTVVFQVHGSGSTESNFTELVNDTFDMLNSIEYPRMRKPPLGVIPQVRAGSRKSLLPFQKGFRISIKSLIGLFEDMRSENMSYILTSRLNQDCLENFFSHVRGLGVFYNNPTPFEVRSNKIPLSGGVSVEARCDQ
ncbi:hypothetical protein PR048_023163 [Dryococelus australis]|uniref:THAP-type domain-containing protein n=1 Tax=Dryococelus australis TaxID=614101 RepID=A0ABQ9GTE1_9NEOP|nr:hypothetical protein PR048_023163 [Dryococelus australis]